MKPVAYFLSWATVVISLLILTYWAPLMLGAFADRLVPLVEVQTWPMIGMILACSIVSRPIRQSHKLWVWYDIAIAAIAFGLWMAFLYRIFSGQADLMQIDPTEKGIVEMKTAAAYFWAILVSIGGFIGMVAVTLALFIARSK